MVTVASILTKCLKNWGVSHVFGVPGKAVTPLILELDHQGIHYVLSKFEGAAGFEATGYALASQTLGVAIGTSGPGGTNMITSAAQAQASHAPVLFITGHPAVKATGTALGQDASGYGVDIVRLFEPVTKLSCSVERGDKLSIYLRHAIELAFTGVKGPVHLNIPADVLMEEIEPFDLSLPDHISPMISSNINEVIHLLDQAEKPLLFLGKGVHSAHAYSEVQELAERWNVPVMTTPSGKGTFPTNHELSLGGFGLGGTNEADHYLKEEVDLMLVLGTRLSDMTLAGFSKEMYPKTIIHFDMDMTFIGKTISVPTIPVLGDLRANVERILELTNNRTRKSYSVLSKVTSSPSNYYKEPYISSGLALKTIQSKLPKESMIFGDCGSHTFYAIRDLEIYKPGHFIFDSYFGAMGHGIGYAIGGKAARPDLPIICITGDGCLLMHGTEISTSVNNDLPVIFVVLNNGRLDMVDKGMAAHLGRAVGTVNEVSVNGAVFGQSLGAHGFRCFTIEEIHHAVDFALQANCSTVIEVMVDPEEIPPTMKRG